MHPKQSAKKVKKKKKNLIAEMCLVHWNDVPLERNEEWKIFWKKVTVGLEADHIAMLSNECLPSSLYLLASLFYEINIQFLREKRKLLGYKKMPPQNDNQNRQMAIHYLKLSHTILFAHRNKMVYNPNIYDGIQNDNL